MNQQKFRVGIVGLQPGRSWAAMAHLPALRHLSDDFDVVGVANSSHASAQAAAAACGIPRAFADLREMVASPDVDIVAVTVKVPAHWDIVRAALEAGKHVYCEWPLGRSLEEAEELARLAHERGVLAVTGTQARVTPAMRQLKRLVDEGFVGKVLSTHHDRVGADLGCHHRRSENGRVSAAERQRGHHAHDPLCPYPGRLAGCAW